MDTGKIRLRSLMLPDYFIEHGTQPLQLEEAGLTISEIVKTVAGLVAGGSDKIIVNPLGEKSNVKAMSS